MTLNNGEIIVIDPDSAVAYNVKYMLSSSFRNVAIINTRCLCDRIEEIKQLMKEDFLLKMVYGCNEVEYKAIVDKFKPVGDVFYLGKRLFFSEAVICYWKNKGFQQFDPTLILSRHGLELL